MSQNDWPRHSTTIGAVVNLMSYQTGFNHILRLWQHISQRRRRQYGIMLILMILTSFAEIITIGSVLPFLTVITTPERIFSHELAQPVIQILHLTEPRQLLLPTVLVFGVVALISGGMRILLIYTSNRLSFATGADLSIEIYRRTLYQSYAVHATRNSSKVIDAIIVKIDVMIYEVLRPILIVTSSVLILVTTLIALIAIDPLVTLALFGGFGALYGLIIQLTRRELGLNSKRIAHESTQVLKTLQEGLGGIRDVLVDGSQEAYCQIYRNADLNLRYAQARNQFIMLSPRYALEAFGMIIIAGLTYTLSQQAEGITKAIPTLGAIALGAQRLLPMLQQGYQSFASIKGNQASLQDVLNLLEQPLPIHANEYVATPISFAHSIEIKGLSFRYAGDAHWILHDITLTLPKGSRTGFIGATGSGKSTLLDVIMGLLEPAKGIVSVDGQPINSGNTRAWQTHIAHVPQTIYLADRTIEENIAISVPKSQIDRELVRRVASQAQIADIIESWPDQYQTIVGERGIRLSGGQRQRIGIARALYKEANVIIFDEATSSLDNETERAVMEVIETLSHDLTILIIAHRTSTLQSCDQIIELCDGGVLWTGDYPDLLKKETRTEKY